MGKAQVYVVAVLAVLVVGGVVAQRQSDKAKHQAKGDEVSATPVSVMAVTPSDLVERVEVTGTLQPADEVVVGPRIAGRIEWIVGKAGTSVKAGDVVARLENRDALAQVENAKAAVTAARARLMSAKAGVLQQSTSTDTGIKAAQASLEAAKARWEQAKAATEQQTTATDTGIQSAEAAVEAARARHKQAQTSAEAAKATADAQVKFAQAALDAAESRLSLVKNGARNQERSVAENSVRLAKANYERDLAQYNRIKNLYDNGGASASQLDISETQMKVSKAQLDSAEQQLSMVREGARQEDIEGAEAAVRQAREGLETAKAGLKQVDVARDNVEIARTGVLQAEAALESAKAVRKVNVMRDKDVMAAQAVVRQAQQAVESAKAAEHMNVMRDSDVLSAQASLEQAKAQLTIALQNLDNTLIETPVDGVVAEKMAQVGESIGSNDPVLKLSTARSLFFEAKVSELEATRLHAGQPVDIHVDALQGDRSNFYAKNVARTIRGAVEKVVPVVDARTRNFTVRIVVQHNGDLMPGMFARGEIIVANHQQVLAVPKDAIVEKGYVRTVFVAAAGKAQQRPVKLGVSNESTVQILSGIAAGEQLIISGQQSLMNNDKVAPRTK